MKYQTEDKGFLLDTQVEFDLTGATPPVLSAVKETPSDQKSEAQDDFSKELDTLEKGVAHVAIYTPENGTKIETNIGKTTAIRQKIILD